MADETPETQPVLRHLLTGTPCPVRDCEECALQWMLAGQIYLTMADALAEVTGTQEGSP